MASGYETQERKLVEQGKKLKKADALKRLPRLEKDETLDTS